MPLRRIGRRARLHPRRLSYRTAWKPSLHYGISIEMALKAPSLKVIPKPHDIRFINKATARAITPAKGCDTYRRRPGGLDINTEPHTHLVSYPALPRFGKNPRCTSGLWIFLFHLPTGDDQPSSPNTKIIGLTPFLTPFPIPAALPDSGFSCFISRPATFNRLTKIINLLNPFSKKSDGTTEA